MNLFERIKQSIIESKANFGVWVVNLRWLQALAFVAPGIILAIISYLPGVDIANIAQAVIFIGATIPFYKFILQGPTK